MNIDINLSNMIYSSKCECRTSENNSSVAKTDSKSTVPTTCYLPDFFIFGKPSACISLYISSYGSVKCRPFSCQAGGRGFESLRSRSERNTIFFSIKASLHCGAFCFIHCHIYSFIPK